MPLRCQGVARRWIPRRALVRLTIVCDTHYHVTMTKPAPPHDPPHPPPEVLEKLTLELRRGVIVLACLSQLDEPAYGYDLQQRLAERGMEIEQGTLYPLLRRLQEQGILAEEWRIEGSRPRKYYQLTPGGARARAALQAQWEEMTKVLGTLLDTSGGD